MPKIPEIGCFGPKLYLETPIERKFLDQNDRCNKKKYELGIWYAVICVILTKQTKNKKKVYIYILKNKLLALNFFTESWKS